MENQGKSKSKNNPEEKESRKFPVVGIGASAGGLEALGKMFSNMPSDSGSAFVLIQHLDPSRKSSMVELLARYTDMEVLEIEDEMRIQPNKLYVTPPNKNVGIINGALHLTVPKEPHGLRRPIDFFFQSLAEDMKEYAIAIILSGFGSDGTIGIKAIKSMGGMIMAQDPNYAVSGSMPSSAIETDLVDYIAPPEKIREDLISYIKRIGRKPPKKIIGEDKEAVNSLQKILILIRNRTGHDFSLYKESTINRRIARRMNVHQIDNVSDYLRYIHKNPKEVNILFKELLINVTSFFRDPDSFKSFKSTIISEVLDKKLDGEKVRIWIPGCSTGEEVYSIAIIIQEYLDSGKHLEIQLFGTDIDEDAINVARSATYSSTIVSEVSSERLKRFFTKKGEGYKVKKNIREMAIFAPHDVLINPPFSKLDAISCRNVLIYMNRDAQKKILSAFTYALKPGGILFLGPSESISNFVESFTSLNNKWKIFKSKKSDYHSAGDFVRFPYVKLPQDYTDVEDLEIIGKTDTNIAKNVEKLLVEKYAPPTAIVNNDGKVIFIHGRVGKYLEPAAGVASLNIVDMTREGIKFELNSAINEAVLKNKDVVYKNLEVKTNGTYQPIDLIVRPIDHPKLMEGLLMVTFKDVELPSKDAKEKIPKGALKKEVRIKELEEELRVTKDRLHTTIEELETSNEELKSANEELQSMNEELQSTNEELETSKEELQSLNEELLTVNTELQNKVDQLSEVNDDMNNLLNSIEFPTIFVDKDIKIKRYTKEATELVNLIPTDTGRPLKDIVSNVEYKDMIKDIKEVMDRVIFKEKEVHTKDGKWYLARIIPYKTTENIIDGAVVTFIDITEQKEVENLASQLEYVKAIVDTVREPLIILDDHINVISANKSFYGKFKVKEKVTEGKSLYSLGNRQWDIPELRDLLENILPENHKFENFIVKHEFPEIGPKKMLLNGRKVQEKKIGQKTIGRGLILLAIEDVTDDPEYQKK